MEHSHQIVKGVASTHVDSFGLEFGDAEHEDAEKDVNWDRVRGETSIVTHTHDRVEEDTHPESGAPLLRYTPKRTKKEERELREHAEQQVTEPTASTPGASFHNPTAPAPILDEGEEGEEGEVVPKAPPTAPTARSNPDATGKTANAVTVKDGQKTEVKKS